MFFGKFADEGDNPVNNPNIYNVDGDNRLSPGLQPLTSGSVLKIRLICVFFNPVPKKNVLWRKLFCCLLQKYPFKL